MKTITAFLLLILVIPVSAACEPPQGANRTSDRKEAVSLDDFEWEQRVMILFAAGPRDRDYQKQQEAFAEVTNELKERDLVIVAAFADGSGMIDGRPIDQRSVRDLRRQFQPATNAYTFVLVGKDGTEKMRTIGEPAKPTRIFETVDAMPMRQREMSQDDADK